MTSPPDHWTPDLVSARLIEAQRFLRFTPGGVGPDGYRSAMPVFRPSMEDFLEEGWGLPEPPDEDASEPPPRLTADQIGRVIASLEWVAEFLAPAHPEAARAVNAWVCARAYDVSFKRVLQERGLSRTRAYALRDRGLSIISVELQRRGVPPWPSIS